MVLKPDLYKEDFWASEAVDEHVFQMSHIVQMTTSLTSLQEVLATTPHADHFPVWFHCVLSICRNCVMKDSAITPFFDVLYFFLVRSDTLICSIA